MGEHVSFWTSGNRRKTDGVYIWANWKPFSFTDWKSGNPDNSKAKNGEEKECVEINGFLKWSNNFCSNELYFMCETHESDLIDFMERHLPE